jgi:hypothetical protein
MSNQVYQYQVGVGTVETMFIVRHRVVKPTEQEYLDRLRKEFIQPTKLIYTEPPDKPLYEKHYRQIIGRTQRSSVENRCFSINQITSPNKEEVNWVKEGF